MLFRFLHEIASIGDDLQTRKQAPQTFPEAGAPPQTRYEALGDHSTMIAAMLLDTHYWAIFLRGNSPVNVLSGRSRPML